MIPVKNRKFTVTRMLLTIIIVIFVISWSGDTHFAIIFPYSQAMANELSKPLIRSKDASKKMIVSKKTKLMKHREILDNIRYWLEGELSILGRKEILDNLLELYEMLLKSAPNNFDILRDYSWCLIQLSLLDDDPDIVAYTINVLGDTGDPKIYKLLIKSKWLEKSVEEIEKERDWRYNEITRVKMAVVNAFAQSIPGVQDMAVIHQLAYGLTGNNPTEVSNLALLKRHYWAFLNWGIGS